MSSIFVCMRRVFGFIHISSIVNGLLFDSGLNVPKELRTHPLIISRISYFWFIKFIICLCVCGYLCLFTNDRNLNIYIHFLFALYYSFSIFNSRSTENIKFVFFFSRRFTSFDVKIRYFFVFGFSFDFKESRFCFCGIFEIYVVFFGFSYF